MTVHSQNSPERLQQESQDVEHFAGVGSKFAEVDDEEAPPFEINEPESPEEHFK